MTASNLVVHQRVKSVPLRRVARLVNGGTPSPDVKYWNGDVPWATPIDLAKVNGGVLLETDRTLTSAGLAAGSRVVPAASIILSTRAPIGYVASVARPTAFNQGCRGVVPGDLVDPRFLQLVLISRQAELMSLGTGSTFQELSTEALGALEVPLPPVEEQRRISDFLDDHVARIDRILAETSLQAALVEERRSTAIVDTMLDGGTLLGRAPWFLGLPDTVTPVPLRAMWNVIDCKHRTPDYQDDGIPVVSPGDIKPGRLDLSRATRFVNETDYLDLADDLRRCRRGDLVYSRNASAGIPAYVDTNEPFTMGQDVCRITSRHNSQLFLAYALQHLTGPQLDSVRVGSTFTRINVDEIKNLRVPKYDLETQQRLAGQCDHIAAQHDEWLAALNSRAGLLEERKKAVITAAVTGELDVTTARPINVGKWVPNVGTSIDTPAVATAPSIGGIG